MLIGFLRFFLVAIIAGAGVIQGLIPVVASSYGEQYWEVTPLVVPFSIAGIIAVLCLQVAVVAIWKLLTLVGEQDVFSWRAQTWVNVIVICGAVAAVIGAGAGAYLGFIAQIGGPMVILLLMVSLTAGATFVLLMWVLRGLLASATVNRQELAEVI